MEEKKPFGYIYDIVCCLNDQEYIGQTTQTVKERFKGHCKSHKTHIDKAIFSYGRENFLVFTLRECYSQAELDKWERWIIFAKGTKEPFGYNVADGGQVIDQTGENNHAYDKPAPNRKSVYPNLLKALAERGITTYRQLCELMGLSDKTIQQKMHGDVLFTQEQQDFLVDYLGKPAEYLFARSDGKNSLSTKGQTLSPEHRDKISEKVSGENNPSYGKPSPRRKSVYPRLLEKMAEKGYNTYEEFAVPMEMSVQNLSYKMSGKQNFTLEQQARLVTLLDAPIEYLLERDDGKKTGGRKARQKSPLQNLIAKMKEKGYNTYGEFAAPMEMKPNTLSLKMCGKSPFMPEQQSKLVEVLEAPIEYLLERTDGKSVNTSSLYKTPFPNLLAKMKEKGYNTYTAFAVPMEMKPGTLAQKVRGEQNFTPEQKARLVEVLEAPIEYLLAREDG